MADAPTPNSAAGKRSTGLLISILAIAAAVVLAVVVIRRNITHPSTDDATAVANVIGLAPRVSGPIVEIAVTDNQSVKQGDVLYRVDPRPYELTLERALATKLQTSRQIETTTR